MAQSLSHPTWRMPTWATYRPNSDPAAEAHSWKVVTPVSPILCCRQVGLSVQRRPHPFSDTTNSQQTRPLGSLASPGRGSPHREASFCRRCHRRQGGRAENAAARVALSKGISATSLGVSPELSACVQSFTGVELMLGDLKIAQRSIYSAVCHLMTWVMQPPPQFRVRILAPNSWSSPLHTGLSMTVLGHQRAGASTPAMAPPPRWCAMPLCSAVGWGSSDRWFHRGQCRLEGWITLQLIKSWSMIQGLRCDQRAIVLRAVDPWSGGPCWIPVHNVNGLLIWTVGLQIYGPWCMQPMWLCRSCVRNPRSFIKPTCDPSLLKLVTSKSLKFTSKSLVLDFNIKLILK
jgi:hypothetical protein